MNLEGNRRWLPLRIRVIEVNFDQKKRHLVRVNGNSSYPSSSYPKEK